MAETSEVVIIGAGIVGCATAYYLAKQGIKSIIIEKDAVATHASGFSAGLLNPLYGSGIPGPAEKVAHESFDLHGQWEQDIQSESGVDPQYSLKSALYTITTEEEADEYSDLFELAKRVDRFGARWIDGDEVRSLEPRVSTKVIKGMYLEGMKQVDSYQLTLGLLQAAEKYGATMRHGTVTGLKRSQSRVTGVQLDSGEISCAKVIVAMGPWTQEAEAWLGIPIPIRPLKGQILRLEVDGPPVQQSLYPSGGGYVSTKFDGLVWVGTTEEEVGFDDHPTPEARDYIMKLVLEVMPSLSEARVALQTACLRPLSADGLPIIGEVPGWEGVYLATGAGRKGILLAPAMAQAIVDLTTSGHTKLSIDGFSPGRFIRV